MEGGEHVTPKFVKLAESPTCTCTKKRTLLSVSKDTFQDHKYSSMYR